MANGNGMKKEGGGGKSSEGFLESVEEKFKQSYAGRLKKARDEQRKAEIARDAEVLRASQSIEEAEKQIAALKRGSAVNVLEVCGSAAMGLALGITAQKMIDVRVKGVPVNGVVGLAGLGAGLALDEDISVRTVFAVGGTMFMAGSMVYAYLTPPPPETKGS